MKSKNASPAISIVINSRQPHVTQCRQSRGQVFGRRRGGGGGGGGRRKEVVEEPRRRDVGVLGGGGGSGKSEVWLGPEGP